MNEAFRANYTKGSMSLQRTTMLTYPSDWLMQHTGSSPHGEDFKDAMYVLAADAL
jgi:hypothetical protein